MRYIFGLALLMSTNPAFCETLDAKAIQAELIGQSISWWDAQGEMKGEMLLLPGGKARITIDSPERASDEGHWSLQDNQLCTVWSTMRSGTAKCYTLSEVAPGHFVTSGGNEFALREVAV